MAFVWVKIRLSISFQIVFFHIFSSSSRISPPVSMRLYIIKVYFSRLFTVLLKNMLLNTSDNQCICIKPGKNFKKTLLKVWLLFIKPLLLHPLSRGKDITNEMMEQTVGRVKFPVKYLILFLYKRARTPRFVFLFFTSSGFGWNKKNKKTSEKIWRLRKNVLPLHPLSQRKQRFFERL